MTHTIQYDKNEVRSGVPLVLADEGAELEATTLEVGDYAVPALGLCFERKTVGDLIQSVYSGHLQKQMLDMTARYPRAYLLISGSFLDYYADRGGGVTPNHWVGMLSSIATRYDGLRIVQLDTDKLLAKTLVKIVEKSADGKSVTIRHTELLKNQLRSEDVAVRVLCGFEGIGVKRAQKLLEDDGVRTSVAWLAHLCGRPLE